MNDFFDAVIIDVDGTIWNTTGIVSVAWNKAINEWFPDCRKVTALDLQKEFGKTMEVIAYDLWPELSADERKILMAHCCTEEQIGIKNNQIDISYTGVIETIKQLSQVINLFVVSNCQKGYIELMLEKTNLQSYIKDFECYGRTGKGKAENIMLLSSRNNLHNPLYVGDTLGDYEACKQAGVSFAWASYGFGKVPEANIKLTQFSDLKSLFSERVI